MTKKLNSVGDIGHAADLQITASCILCKIRYRSPIGILQPPSAFEYKRYGMTWSSFAVSLNNIELRQTMEYQQNFRYGVIGQKVSIFTYIVWGVLLLLAVATSLFIPLCWITVIIIGFVVCSLYTPRMTVFDFQEKKFFSVNVSVRKKQKK